MLYAGSILLLNIPFIQQRLAIWVGHKLSHILNTEVTIGRIDMGLLNRVIIDDLMINDQMQAEMLKVTRLSAKFEILPLFKQEVRINSVQLFGFNIELSKETPHSPSNFQFVIDALSSNGDSSEKNNLNLRINSILIRRGKLSYDVLSADVTPDRFNPQHLLLKNIIANISLKALQSDSLNIAVKRLSVEEQSGIELKKLTFKLAANSTHTVIDNFAIELPQSVFQLDTIKLRYDSIEAFKNARDLVSFSFKTLPSYITPQDLSSFIPVFANFKDKVDIDIIASGTLNRLNCDKLSLKSNQNFQIMGNVSLQDLSNPHNAFVFGQLSSLSCSQSGLEFLFRNLIPDSPQTPKAFTHLGNISFKGEISGYFTDLVTYGLLKTDIGSLNTDLKLMSDLDKGLFAYSGSIKTEGFDLGRMFANKDLGETVFNVDVEGAHLKKQKPEIFIKGLISTFGFKNYDYENIHLDAEYGKRGISGKLVINDQNGSLFIDGTINLEDKIPSFNFTAGMQNIYPNRLNLTKQYEDADFSVKMKANFQGSSIDNLTGTINIDSLYFNASHKSYFMEHLSIKASNKNSLNTLTVNSEFIKAKIEGSYKYKTLPHSLTNIVHHYLPSVFPEKIRIKEVNNNFDFDINVFDTKILETMLNIPLHLYTPATIKGYVSDQTQRVRLEGYFPRLRYKNNYIESGVFMCTNSNDQIESKVRFTNRKSNDAFNVSLFATAANDGIQTTIDWGNNANMTYSGKLATMTQFVRTKEQIGRAHV